MAQAKSKAAQKPKGVSAAKAKTPRTAATATKTASARPVKKPSPKSKSSGKPSTPKQAPRTPEAVALAAVKRVARPSVVLGFADFLREQNVVSLAVGLVIGAQVKSLTDQLIQSFINPLLGLVLPGRGALDQQTFILHLRHKQAVFSWGSFAATLLSFVTAAAVVYFGFKLLKLDRLAKKKDTAK